MHGIKRAEQALPVLRHIPYHLVVIDSEISGVTATEFARILDESGKWKANSAGGHNWSRRSIFSRRTYRVRCILGQKICVERELSKLFATSEVPSNIKQTVTIRETFLGIGYTRDRAGLPLEAVRVPVPRPARW